MPQDKKQFGLGAGVTMRTGGDVASAELTDLAGIIQGMDLSDAQKGLMASRWLLRVADMETEATRAKGRYHFFRLIVIVGSAIVPAMVTAMASMPELRIGGVDVLGLLAVLISLAVTISASISEFFKYGDRWRHYRATVESLKSEGWQFIQSTGSYRSFKKHDEGYKRFASKVERLLSEERKEFMRDIAEEKEHEEAGETQQAGNQLPPNG